MSLPREWSLYYNQQQEKYYSELQKTQQSNHKFYQQQHQQQEISDNELQRTDSSSITSSQDMDGQRINDENLNNQLGSLCSIQSAPTYDLSNGENSAIKRPSSLVVQVAAVSTPMVPPHFSTPDTLEDEENDNFLTISSVTARPLIAKSRELRTNKNNVKKKKCKQKVEDVVYEPLDSGYGWVIVFGAFFVQFWVAGLIKSYGVFHMEVMEMFPNSSVTLASWIPASLSCLCFALAPVTSMLSQKYSCRAVVFIGGLFCALGLILSSFATNLIHLFFTFGVLTGIGGGLSTTPGIILVSQYFDKHRALANGICVSGTAAGGFVFPFLIEKLVDKFGFHGTILILGGCMLHVCVSATLYRPLEDNPRAAVRRNKTTPAAANLQASGEKKNCENAKDYPNKQQQLEILFTQDPVAKRNLLNEVYHQNNQIANGDTTIDLKEAEEIKAMVAAESIIPKPIHKIRSSGFLHSIEDLSTDSTCVYKARSSLRSLRSSTMVVGPQFRLPDHPPSPVVDASTLDQSLFQKICRYIDLTLLTQPPFVAICLSVMLMSTGSPYALYYVPAYVHARGYTKPEAGYLVAISAAFDLFGRLGLGWISDLGLFDRKKGYIGSIVGAGIAVLMIPITDSFYVLACFTGIYGLCLGSWFLLVPVLLADEYGTEKISSTYGLVRMFQSVGAITIPPLAGYLRDVTGSYSICFLGMGTCMVCGGLPLLLISKSTKSANEGEKSSI